MNKLQQLRVTRPDGSVLYEMALHEHHEPILLGKLCVVDGRIVLQCAVDDFDVGSIVTPTVDWVGDMAFSVSERRNDDTTKNSNVLAGDGQHGKC